MSDTRELVDIVSRLTEVEPGAVITLSYDQEVYEREGRNVVSEVTVSGVNGIGQHPMGAIAAKEAMRRAISCRIH